LARAIAVCDTHVTSINMLWMAGLYTLQAVSKVHCFTPGR
jgi:hypothetical protein